MFPVKHNLKQWKGISEQTNKSLPICCNSLEKIEYIYVKTVFHMCRLISQIWQIFLLVHLSRRLKCTVVITRCLSSVVVNFSHFQLLL